MKDSNVFIAEPSNEKPAIAFSAFVRALHQSNRVAILRCVYRANQGSVALMVGTPCLAEEDHLVSRSEATKSSIGAVVLIGFALCVRYFLE
jgi:hypothetical protein